MKNFYYVDTHCHLDLIPEIPIETIVSNSLAENVQKIVIPGVSTESFETIINLCDRFENVYCMLGIHPTETKDWDDSVLEKIRELSVYEKVVGIGEIGLDYYWDTSFNDIQQSAFIKQIQLANELNLPIAVHDREAHKDTFDLLKEYNKTSDVIMHCFSGSAEFAKQCIKQGFYIALGGVITFKNAKKMKDVAAITPIEKLLLETDAPYLTPVPYRGKINQPSYIPLIAQEIANIKGISVEDVAKITTESAERIFRF